MIKKITYKAQLTLSTGFDLLSIVPVREISIKEILEYLHIHPNDKFMHKYLLYQLMKLSENELDELIEEAKKKDDLLSLACFYEICICYNKFFNLRKKFNDIDKKILAKHTPLIYIRWSLSENLDTRCFWMDIFAKNKYMHESLPSLNNIKFPIPYDLNSLIEDKKIVHIKDVYSETEGKSFNTGTAVRSIDPKETVNRLLKNPTIQELLLDDEIKLTCSISPYAFIRNWNFRIEVSVGKNNWTLWGILGEYGKGFSEDAARASALMEIVERYSALANFSNNKSIGYKKEFKLIKARYSDLIEKGYHVLDPNKMNLEIPYENQELYWIIAEEVDEMGSHEIYIPAQFAFLISSGNFDEIDIYSQGTSTNGLASGNTIEEAKLTALLEYIERDSEKVSLFSLDRCFLLEAKDPIISNILDAWRKRGVHIYFLDLTTELGIPCYRAFFIHKKGGISRGWGAHLNGKIAINRALCELTCRYFLYGDYSTIPLTDGVQIKKYEELPNYSSGDVNKDLWMLEKLLLMNGFHPIYVNLTKEDLDIPVIRTIVPGLEMLPDLDRYSSFNKRLFKNYLRIVQKES